MITRRNYAEYGQETPIPNPYELSMEEMIDMLNSTQGRPDALWLAIVGIYKYGFMRGQKYERKQSKRKSQGA